MVHATYEILFSGCQMGKVLATVTVGEWFSLEVTLVWRRNGEIVEIVSDHSNLREGDLEIELQEKLKKDVATLALLAS